MKTRERIKVLFCCLLWGTIFVLLAYSLWSCHHSTPVTVRYWLESGFMLGEHELCPSLEKTSEISGSSTGRFFLGTGSFEGNISSEESLKFTWEYTDGVFYTASLPYRFFRWVIDDSKENPTITFEFEEKFLNSPQKEDFPQEIWGNPNRLLEVGKMYQRDDVWGWDREPFPIFLVAVIKISEEDAANEPFVPRFR